MILSVLMHNLYNNPKNSFKWLFLWPWDGCCSSASGQLQHQASAEPIRNSNINRSIIIIIIVLISRYCKCRLWYWHSYLSLRSSGESVSLEQLNEGNLSLQQSQPHPNTDARTKTKWHVAQLRPLGFLFRRKPVGYNTIIQVLNNTCSLIDEMFMDR